MEKQNPQLWKIFISVFILIPALDFLWLGNVAADHYLERAYDVLLIGADGRMQPVLWAAIPVYFFLAYGLTAFAYPKAAPKFSNLKVFKWGAIFGMTAYGIYDFTNHSVLKLWPLDLVFLDVLWGGFVCGTSLLLGHLIKEKTA